MKQSLKQREQLQGYRTQHNVIHVDPVAKPRMTQRDRWAQRKCVLDYWAYRDALRPLMEILGPLEGIDLEFRIPMPKSWSKKKKNEHDGEPHCVKPDIDNFIKGLLDVLEEDKQIHWVSAQKVWAHEGSISIRTNHSAVRTAAFDAHSTKYKYD